VKLVLVLVLYVDRICDDQGFFIALHAYWLGIVQVPTQVSWSWIEAFIHYS
jgi:hypothetical protein